MKQSSQLFHDSIDNTANQRVTAQTPLDIMEEYNGCSVGRYRRYRLLTHRCKGGPFENELFLPVTPKP